MQRAFLAIVGPVVVIAGFLAWGTRPPVAELNEHARELDALLAEGPVDFVSVGPSVAARDVHFLGLERDLGLERGVPVSMDASMPAHWYAMLKYRVFDAGYQPKFVLIVAPLSTSLNAAPLTAKQMGWLTPHVGEPDEVLASKVFGYSRAPWIENLLLRRAGITRSIVDPLRGWPVGLLFGPNHAPSEGEALNAAASTVVFENATGNLGGARILPVVEEEAASTAAAPLVGGGLLPDVLDLIRANGSKAVVVRVPLSPTARDYDQLSALAEREGIAMINAHGAGYLDMRESVTNNAEFQDQFHLSGRGRVKFTLALTERLKALGVMGSGPLASARLPLLPVITREGTATVPPIEPSSSCTGTMDWPHPSFGSLRALGIMGPSPFVVTEGGEALPMGKKGDQGCSGTRLERGQGILVGAKASIAAVRVEAALAPPADPEASWWVAPGTSLRVAFASPWEGGELVAKAVGISMGTGSAPALLSLEGQPGVPLIGSNEVVSGQVRAASSGASWALRVDVPAGGAWLNLRALTLGEGAGAVQVAGPPVHDRVIAREEWICSGAPALQRTPTPSGRPNEFLLPGTPVTAEELFTATNQRIHTPFDVLVNGQPLKRGKAPEPGVYALVAGRLVLHPADAAGRVEVQRTANPDFKGGRWLQPGDTCTRELNPRVIKFAGRAVLISAFRAGAQEGTLSVRVSNEAGEVLSATPDWSLLATLARLTFPSWQAERFTITLSTPESGPYVFIRSIAVTDADG